MPDSSSFSVLGFRINAAPFDAILARVIRAPESGERLALHFATAHTLVVAQQNARLRESLESGLIEPDGMPLVWLGRRAGLPVERVCGPDFMPAVLEHGIDHRRKHYFYGGASGVPEQLARRMAARYPGLRVVGTRAPPFRPLTRDEEDAIVAEINAADPDYVWVGLGTPKQDVWIGALRPRLNAAAVLAVGAAFDFHAGRRRRAPKWMQRSGTEWIYRLAMEPRRLARRYTATNARFLQLVLREQLRRLWRLRPGEDSRYRDRPAPRIVVIGGIPVENITFDEAVELISDWAIERSGGYVYTPNVDDVVKASRLPDFRRALLGARLRVPDGMGIIYGSRIAGTPLRGTVTGRKLPLAVGMRLASDTSGIALFGGPPGTAQQAAQTLARHGVHVKDAFGPPMGFEVGSPEDDAATRRLAKAHASIVFVGLGAPKQALWMERRHQELDGAVLVGVGAAIDTLAGRVRQAPDWMTRVGFEWLFRVVFQPRRLAKRYFVDDPRFFWWMAKHRWSNSGPKRCG